jgi:hypothetical protein
MRANMRIAEETACKGLNGLERLNKLHAVRYAFPAVEGRNPVMDPARPAGTKKMRLFKQPRPSAAEPQPNRNAEQTAEARRVQRTDFRPSSLRSSRLCGWTPGRRAVALLFAASLCGCSTFNRDWRRAAVAPQAENSLEGRWEGRWRSDEGGHHGELRCLMSRQSDSVYQARFRAAYGRLLHFSYTARLEMQRHDIGWEFDGEADLGKLGGIYYYEGRATLTNLISTYRSKYDHGLFELNRLR